MKPVLLHSQIGEQSNLNLENKMDFAVSLVLNLFQKDSKKVMIKSKVFYEFPRLPHQVALVLSQQVEFCSKHLIIINYATASAIINVQI